MRKNRKISDDRQRSRVNIWIKSEHAEAVDKTKRDPRLSRQEALDDLLAWALRRKGALAASTASASQPAA